MGGPNAMDAPAKPLQIRVYDDAGNVLETHGPSGFAGVVGDYFPVYVATLEYGWQVGSARTKRPPWP